MLMRSLAGIPFLLATLFATVPANAVASDCLAMAQGPGLVQPAAYAPTALQADQVQLTFVGHATFVIESPGGVRIATDYDGYAGDVLPDVVTMNHAHSSHYTDNPDPAIKHVLRGWGEDGQPAQHNLTVGDVRIRNVTTDIRGGMTGRRDDANSIFIFEVAGLCIGHLGHLHHELTPQHVGLIGRLDVVLVPVDGGYTMAQASMMNVLKDLKARLVIPMHFFGPTTLSRFISNASADFEVEMAASPVTIVSASSLPQRPKLLVLPGH
ncbi:MAG: MBL fold metallo-hydrolase [Rhizobiales bacterium]|nr:MBL fold metallo-hydrolase [Hyphomicrobiales bacterium]